MKTENSLLATMEFYSRKPLHTIDRYLADISKETWD
jgi:hypothetical protein